MKRNVFTDLSIRKKLPLILVATCLLALLLAGAAFLVNQRRETRAAMVENISTLAKVIASRSTAALIFDDNKMAAENLGVLALLPQLDEAAIFLEDGSLFTTYIREGKQSNWPKQISRTHFHIFNDDIFELFQPIELEGKQLGVVYIQANLEQYNLKLQEQAAIAILIIIVTLMMAFLLSRRSLKSISQPIIDLAALTRDVAEKKDYTLRAPAQNSRDEIGRLVADFNNMLVQVEKRDVDLLESKNRFRSLLDQAGDAFFLHDFEGRFVEVNERACESLGYSREELLSMTVFDIDADFKKESHKEKIWDTIVPGHPGTFYGTHRRKDGTTFPVEVRIAVVIIENTRYLQGLARDISERQQAESEKEKLENQLRHAQKMEAIGTLAGGIAHDFNNILAAIFGYTELALVKEDCENCRQDLEQVMIGAERARLLVKQILAFSHKTDEERQPLEVALILKESLKMLRSSLPTTIEIRQDILSNGTVLADPTQIHQIIMNLCTNAYHAMRETGGTLAVSLGEIEIRDEDEGYGEMVAGRYLKLDISDSGCGMSPEIQEKIFEPYFTTKKTGEGTGLGLAVVHGIVKSYHGHISVYSESGRGTTFHVYLPLIEEKPVELPPTEVTVDLAGHGESILFVDDEAQIREFADRLFSMHGYQVTIFTNGVQAFEEFQKHPDQYDLAITDMTMPYMTGAELAQKMIGIRPDLPIILCTGQSELINREKALAMGISEYLNKPVVKHDFLVAIRKTLDKKKQPPSPD